MHLKEALKKIISKECSIQVFGLGYVGFPLSIRLAKSGFKVIGIDTDSKKIGKLQKNSLSGSQISLKSSFLESVKNGNFVPSLKPLKSEFPRIGIICVPTPLPDQKIDSQVHVISAVEKFLKTSKRGDVIILESSVIGGTTDKIIKIVSSNGYTVGEDFGVCFCPERIDPLNQKWKLENIPRVIFTSDETTYKIAQEIYSFVNNSELFRVNSSKVAEVVKSFENAFRLVNISLVNELAILCDKLKINVNEVIEATSTKPFGFMSFNSGAGAGGHCIPKDPTFLLDLAKQNKMNFSSVQNAISVNSMIPKYIADTIKNTLSELKLGKSVLVCGLAYKPDSEDMRDSPGFKLANELTKISIKTAAFDPYFKHELLEKYLIENHLDNLEFKILPSLDDGFIKEYDCICVVQNHTITKHRIKEVYNKSLVPLIYDCQNKISFEPKSKTVLRGFGVISHDWEYSLTGRISQKDLNRLGVLDKVSMLKGNS